jgi:2-haloacid dehalogenase
VLFAGAAEIKTTQAEACATRRGAGISEWLRENSMPIEHRPAVLAFDVYGTLIDPFRMEDHLRAFFGVRAKEATELWRSKQLEYSFRRTLMKKYENFDVCTAQALQFVSRQLEVPLADETMRNLLDQYLRLPAYPDVAAALDELEAREFKIVACTNGTEHAVRGLLDRAGILAKFSGIISVDPIRTFKPDPAVYQYLAAQVHAEKQMVCLISSNPFDVIGAKACGLPTVWVQRDHKKIFDPWEFEPDLDVHGLEELSAKLNFK